MRLCTAKLARMCAAPGDSVVTRRSGQQQQQETSSGDLMKTAGGRGSLLVCLQPPMCTQVRSTMPSGHKNVLSEVVLSIDAAPYRMNSLSSMVIGFMRTACCGRGLVVKSGRRAEPLIKCHIVDRQSTLDRADVDGGRHCPLVGTVNEAISDHQKRSGRYADMPEFRAMEELGGTEPIFVFSVPSPVVHNSASIRRAPVNGRYSSLQQQTSTRRVCRISTLPDLQNRLRRSRIRAEDAPVLPYRDRAAHRHSLLRRKDAAKDAVPGGGDPYLSVLGEA
ncbi:hypothetical protein MRX96_009554 [Rhipicephalus microplus]